MLFAAGNMAAAEQGSPTGASSNSLMDDDFSEMMNDLRSELAEVEKQEAQVRQSPEMGRNIQCQIIVPVFVPCADS